MKRVVKSIAILAGGQALLLGIYLAVQHSRQPTQPDTDSFSPATTMDRPTPELRFRSRDGRVGRLEKLRGRPLILHFWASWCAPCRHELPALLDFGQRTKTELLAVALDDEWDAVEAVLGGEPPEGVVLAEGNGSAERFGVTKLPVTFVLGSGGRTRLRLDGQRDWRAGTDVELVLRTLGRR